MDAPLLSADVATLLGTTDRSVQRWARRLQLGTWGPRGREFSADDVSILRRHVQPGPGNPQWTGRAEPEAIVAE